MAGKKKWKSGIFFILSGVLICSSLLQGCADERGTKGVELLRKLVGELRGVKDDAENGMEVHSSDNIWHNMVKLSKEEVSVSLEQADFSAESLTKNKTSMSQKADIFREGFVLKFSGHYGYDALSGKQQLWYDEMVQILNDMDSNVEISLTADETNPDEIGIDRIFHCVMMDHPEFFYVDGYNYNSVFTDKKLTKLSFSGSYTMTKEEAERRLSEIEKEAGRILSGIGQDASDYEKIKYVYETIILNTDYDFYAPDNQNIYSVLAGKASVCQGYSEAMQYLLLRMGVECSVVHGMVREEAHAWNLVKADDEYYYVDVTWGDASYQRESEEFAGNAFVNYDYLCITTEELTKTHSITDEVEMPVCTAKTDNFFVRENLMFDKFDKERLKAVFTEALEKGENNVSVKCTDRDSYRMMLEKLINENEIFELLPVSVKEVNYSENENQYILTFWLNTF